MPRKKPPSTKPKTSLELRKTGKAIQIVAKVLRVVNPWDRTEKDVASEIRRRIYKQGATLSFKPIVSTGRNTRFVHHRPGNRIIRKENPLMIDLGAKYKGQCSDITRMHMPKNKRFEKLYRNTLYIQRRVIKSLKPGLSFKEANEYYKKLMKAKGYKPKHSIGHGLGRVVHESAKVLKPGMVITIEPGVYLKNYGCRIEDMVLIKTKGVEVLSKSISKRL